MGKIRKFLGFLTVLFVCAFVRNAMSAAYTCPTYKTYVSCAKNTYLSDCGSSNWNGAILVEDNLATGNSCVSCPAGYVCDGGLACPKKTEITITYNLNGGTGTAPSPKTCSTTSGTCELDKGTASNTYGRAGYTLMGWSTDSGASSGEAVFKIDNPTSDLTVYAIWLKCPGGTGKPASAPAAVACPACTDYKYSHPTVGICITPQEGYYSTGCGEGGDNCTGQSKCRFDNGTKKAYYCTGGQRYEVKPGYYPTRCGASGTQAGPIANNEQCRSQAQCPVGSYCQNGVLFGCPEGYRDNQTPGLAYESQCAKLVEAGKYVNSSKEVVECQIGYYCPGGLASYGMVGPQMRCAQGYTSEAGAGAKSDCYINVPAGHYRVGTTGQTFAKCPAGTYSLIHQAYDGVMDYCRTPQDGYAATKCESDGTGCTAMTQCYGRDVYCTDGIEHQVDPGYRAYNCEGISPDPMVSNTPRGCKEQIQCTGSMYCMDGIWAYCPNGYDDNPADGKSQKTDCKMDVPAGYYIDVADATEPVECDIGYACPAHTVSAGMVSSTGGHTPCPPNYSSDAGATALTRCYILITGGNYRVGITGTSYLPCEPGSYSETHKAYYNVPDVCSPCNQFTYSGEGATSCKQPDEGYYVTGCDPSFRGRACTGQAQCTGTTYCEDGEKKDCPEPFVDDETDGKSSISQCIVNIDAGYTINSATSYGGLAVCAAGSYCVAAQGRPGHFYSNQKKCPTDYTSETGAKAETECYIDVPGGQYRGGTDGTEMASCPAGTAIEAHKAYYGQPDLCESCQNFTFSAQGATECRTVDTGYYASSCSTSQPGVQCKDQIQCTGATYCEGAKKYDCPDPFTDDTVDGKTHIRQCQAAVPAGSTIVSTGDHQYAVEQCSAGFVCPAATIDYGAPEQNKSVCGDNMWSAAGAAECTPCIDGYSNSGPDAADHAGNASCTIVCPAGQYVETASGKCVSVGDGYFGVGAEIPAGTTGGRTQCPEDYRDGPAATSQDLCLKQEELVGEQVSPSLPENCASFELGTCEPETCVRETYYSGSVKTACEDSLDCTKPITSVVPNPNYYDSSNMCLACPAEYPLSAGTTGGQNMCYKNCTRACEKPACPDNAMCDYTETSTSGTEYYNSGSCSAAESVCEYTFECNTGYHKSDDSAACELNTYTITLNKNGGSGTVNGATGTTDATQQCQHGVSCQLPDGDGLVRENWVFTGWGTTSGCTSGDSEMTFTGAQTIYACWSQTATECKVGQYYNGSDYEDCPKGWYCPGVGNVALDQTGCGTQCPGGGTTDGTGNSASTACYLTCSGSSITGGQTTPVSGKVNYNGSSYPACTYNVSCNPGYVPENVGTASATCTQCENGVVCPGGESEYEPETCPAGSYCVAGIQTACPDGGQSTAGANSSEKCFKTNMPCTVGNGTGTQTCNYDADTDSYTDCGVCNLGACNDGYYNDGGECEICPVGSYCAGGVLKSCPVGGTSDTGAESETQCYRVCEPTLDITNGSASLSTTSKPYYDGAEYAACQYVAECDENYKPQNSPGENPSCVWADADACPVGSYCPPDSAEPILCPDGGTTDGGATDSTMCYKTNMSCSSEHGTGTQTCHYDGHSGYTDCDACVMDMCNDGYYVDNGACTICPIGSFCADGVREECPNDGLTETTGASENTACYLTNVPCQMDSGSGVQTCHYDGSDYEDCGECMVNTCDEGYYINDGECDICPAGSFCTGGVAKSCYTETRGQYSLSDEGMSSINECYRECVAGENVATVEGREYMDGDNTCEITRCVAGYLLNGDACTECSAGSYCDGSETEFSCAALGNGDWSMSDSGATSSKMCYQTCESYPLNGGATAIPLDEQVYYDALCQYRGEMADGTPCMIVGDECIETCASDQEMIDGVCTPCDREHALSYKPNGNCQVASCTANYHPNGDQCEYNFKDCTMPNAEYSVQEWDFQRGGFGACTVQECEYGFHVSGNACVSDVQQCNVENGTGVREWNHRENKWGTCIATYCDPGYTNDPSETNEHGVQCGVCANRFGARGEPAVAVSSYVQGCEIASCMYQGELYNLENNECVRICPLKEEEDETGTRVWDPTREKCVTTCNDGYIPWP